jgi:peroxiredoxin Q/BCP
MRAFQNDIDRFEKPGGQFLGVSGDTLETHKNFARQLGLSFPLLVDDGTIRKLYGSGRITCLIDQSGIICCVHKGMPESDSLIREIGNLQPC